MAPLRPPATALLLALVLTACGSPGRQPVQGAASTGLVFVRLTEGGGDLYRVRLADAAVRPLLVTPDRDESWPFWSDAARRLVFESAPERGPGAATLRLLDPDSGRIETLPPVDALRQHWPAWAAGEARLAYVWNGGAEAASGGVAVLELPGARFRPLVVNQGRIHFYRPEFAPDGRRLVVQRRLADGNPALWILEPGVEPRPLADPGRGLDQKGRFTHDGAWIVFSRRATRRSPGQLMRVRVDGSGLEPLLPGRRADDQSPRPSPVRDEVAFISRRGREVDAFLLELAGGPPRRLTRTPTRDEMAPHWSPDGEYLALTTRPAGTSQAAAQGDTQVVVIDRQGNPLLGVPGTMPDWMPAWE